MPAYMSEPLHMHIEQSFFGERALIVETLHGLADLLQREVVAREPRERPNPSAVDASSYLDVVSAQSGRLAHTFSAAGPAFKAAAEPSGGPQDYCEAYGAVLDDMYAANDAILSVSAPASLKRTEEAYRGLLRAMLDQTKAWRQKLREAAGRVNGNTFEIKLEVTVKITPFDRALAVDKKAMGLP